MLYKDGFTILPNLENHGFNLMARERKIPQPYLIMLHISPTSLVNRLERNIYKPKQSACYFDGKTKVFI